MCKGPEARDNLRDQRAWNKRVGVAVMRNKDEEVETASLDSRELPRPLQYPLPAHISVFQDPLCQPC